MLKEGVTSQKNFRLTKPTIVLLDRIAHQIMDGNQSAVVEYAIAKYASGMGVDVGAAREILLIHISRGVSLGQDTPGKRSVASSLADGVDHQLARDRAKRQAHLPTI